MCLLLVTHYSYANTLYGVEHVNTAGHSIKTPTYVQMGSFYNLSNAKAYQRQLRTKTNQPVVIKNQAGTYKLVVGPFNTSASLNEFARKVTQGNPIAQPKRIYHKPAQHRVAQPQTPMVHQQTTSSPTSGSAHWFVGGQIGGQQSTPVSSTTVRNGIGVEPPFDLDVYSTHDSDQTVMFGVQAGRRWALDYQWFSALSLGVQYQVFPSHVKGQVIQFSLPEFTNYNFKWRMNSNLALVNAKLNLMEYKRFSPYINGGVGALFNTYEHYTETALPGVTARISPSYQGKGNTRFTYILGAGMDYQFSPEFIASAGYQFTDLGVVSTGSGTETWSGQSLNFGDHQSNAFLFGLTYLFDADYPIHATK